MVYEYIIWGNTVPVEPFTEIYFDTEVLQGAHLGIKYVQLYASPYDVPTTGINGLLLTLKTQGLASLATAINQVTGALPEYIKIEWNYVFGGTEDPRTRITDLVIGAVVAPQATPITAANMLEALRTFAPLNQILGGAVNSDGSVGSWKMFPSQYQLGIPASGTAPFHYKLTQTVYTAKRISPMTIANAGTTIDALKADVKTAIISNILSEFTRIANENGCNFTDSRVECNVVHDENAEGIRLTATWAIYYGSDRPIKFDPSTTISKPLLDPITATLLYKIAAAVLTAIIFIVVAYFAIQALKEWFISMTTKTTTHEVCYYDPATGNLIKCEKITEQTPSVEGIFAVIFAIGAVLIGYSFIRGGGRRKDE